jgi:bacterioferritin (cytochrome b1)
MNEWEKLLSKIISSDTLHALWLNTLSYLENCGARKIAKAEDSSLVKEKMLKHAAEEFRHAYHLKRQIARLGAFPLDTYEKILGGKSSQHFLNALDIQISRYLQQKGLKAKEIAYPLVTYVIERRALTLYPLYHRLLKGSKSLVTVASVWLEEEEHLKEMEEELARIPGSDEYKRVAEEIEEKLCRKWLTILEVNISAFFAERGSSPHCLNS